MTQRKTQGQGPRDIGEVSPRRMFPRTSPGAGFVLRDFERSRVLAIRDLVETHPILISGAYFIVAMLWTALITVGSAFYGDNSLAVNQSPHIAHFMLIVGVLIYPRHLLWVPVLGYAAAFALPFFLHAGGQTAWHRIPGLTREIAAFLFLLNLASALATGTLVRIVAWLARSWLRPWDADLVTALTMLVGFVLLGLPVVLAFNSFAQTLPAELAIALGFDGHYIECAAYRLVRGAVVAAGFMLTVIEAPKQRDMALSLVIAMAFPLLVLAQTQGWGMYPMLDAVGLAIVIALAAPIRVAALSALVGVALYAAMTGHFLNDVETPEIHEMWLVRYSVAGLVLPVLILATRSFLHNERRQSDGLLRRMGVVRDFADVGLFSINFATRLLRADPTAQRILSLPRDGPASGMLERFDGADRDDLAEALDGTRKTSAVLRLRMHKQSEAEKNRVVRLFLWYERAPSDDRVAYGLVVDVTLEHEQERVLKATLAELSDRQMKQAQLFSIIGHELRTPAAIISMLLEELDRAPDDARTRRQLKDTSEHLLSVLSDMRQAVTPERNMPLRPVPYRPLDLAEAIYGAFSPMAREAGMQIFLDMGRGAEDTRVLDVRRLRQAISNIAKNAILHSRASELRLSYHAIMDGNGAGRSGIWEIVDNGVGIPEADVDRLFEPFERGGADPAKRADGSGLGLFIARNAATLMGGSLDHFRPVGGGTGYRLILPEAPDQANTPALPPPAPAPTDKAPPAEVGTPYGQMTVLLAEDNALVAEVTAARLARHFRTVETAANGKEALDRLLRGGVDLLISDLFMPEMDGDELIRQLRKRGLKIPVVGLTAAMVGDDMDRLLVAGATHVMTKPLDIAEMLAHLGTLQDNARA